MNIKKVIAPTMPSAMRKVKDELGENAVILHSKVIYRGGFLGLFKKKNIEVIAALDDAPVQLKKKIKTKKPPVHTKTIKVSERPVPPDHSMSDLAAEISELKKEVMFAKRQHEVILRQYPEPIQIILQHLREIEVADAYISELGDELMRNWRTHHQTPSEGEIAAWTKDALVKHLSAYDFTRITNTQKFINFVGPTGVGKTTTIAKIAAEAVLEQKKKVAFITLDTYRIAAIEQLKTYAQLLNTPLEVVYKHEEFQLAVEKFSEYDLVLIDTAGRNYRDTTFIDELNETFRSKAAVETYLVLSISMREADIKQIVENFQRLKFNQFIFTKADETRGYGVMYNLIRTYGKGASYITTGQDVPDDICEANSAAIADYLIGDINI